jgi:cytochrome c oxidase subunit 2
MSRLFWSLLATLLSFPAYATGLAPQPGIGQPVDKGLGLQPPASAIKEQMIWFHNDLLMPIITIITLFVLGLLIWVMIRYNAKANPNPSKTTHNTLIEVVWTVVPILILIVIAIPSLKLLYYTDRAPEQTEMTVKVIGHQWYWEYVYPDHNGITFSAYMKKNDELLPGEPRLLETDKRVVIPVDTFVKLQITAADVLHAWTVPAFGVKKDAVPGRLNEAWVKVNEEGVYYGQCSELCGTDHAYMPIAVEVVSKDAFNSWVAKMQADQGLTPAAAPAETTPTTPATESN